ncbi:peptidase S8 [Blastococcus sp. TF02-09]|uniref:S8 family serine peptidase n=1 Tax=Blastococcus sp. TF02-09 TaxID=2250576 RepID=UPI000DE8DAAD|nr:S8 family serine peptidase [Blastococcus sp. TF02-9]RBY78512.1 peptidase S8 [Blastococcus sp. TF02-9]
MRTGTRRLLAVPAAAVVLVCSAGPATAEEPVSPEVTGLPEVLVDDLARAEQHTLTDLTEGEGVRLEAFVVTPDGPEIVTLDADRRADADAAVRLLEQQASVEAADLTVVARATAGSYPQWGNTTVRSDAARAEVSPGALADVVVAVLDTGVSLHGELAGALLPGRDFTGSPGGVNDDRQGHGTHVAGTVAADAGSVVEGVAAGARVLPVKVLGDDGSGYSSWISGGIVWAADRGADVINMSLGGQYSSTVYDAAVAYARSKGTTVVAAAGNANTSAIFMPAATPGVIGVSATAQNGAKAVFSNYGSYVDVAAPGVDIISTYPGNRFGWMSGTSMASPHVAGVVALMEAAAPSLTPDQVERALTWSATDLGAAGRDDSFGHGQVDGVRAVRAAQVLAGGGTLVRAPSAPRVGAPTALAGGLRLTWSAPADTGGAAVTAYRVSAYRGTALAKSVVVSGQTTSATVTGLTNGTAYRVGIEAANTAGYGARSAQVTATPRTTPGAPTISSVTAQRLAVAVRWTRPASDGGAPLTGYVVQAFSGRTLVKSVTAGATASGVTVGGLKAGTAYTFRVLAKNEAGAGAVSAPSPAARPR